MRLRLFSRSKLWLKELKQRAKRLRLESKERKLQAGGLRGQTKELKELENTLTPIEIAALLQQPKYRELPFKIAPSLSQRPPARYIRYPISQTVNFYSGNCGAPDLLVAFCGATHRLMMPISYLLQLLQEDVYDVLVLSDPTKRHYAAGMPGYSSSFLETLQSIQAFARTKAYRRLITYGTSMGGFPALRAGLWLGADRAISIGGRFCSHAARVADPRHEEPAFDLLCSCQSYRQVRLVAGFSKGNEADAKNYAILKQIMPECAKVTFDASRHLPFEGLSERQLAGFFAKVFGPEPRCGYAVRLISSGVIAGLRKQFRLS